MDWMAEFVRARKGRLHTLYRAAEMFDLVITEKNAWLKDPWLGLLGLVCLVLAVKVESEEELYWATGGRTVEGMAEWCREVSGGLYWESEVLACERFVLKRLGYQAMRPDPMSAWWWAGGERSEADLARFHELAWDYLRSHPWRASGLALEDFAHAVEIAVAQ